MFKRFKPSTGRASLTKAKSLILAALIGGVMAVPSSVFAQVSFGNCTHTIVDDSPDSWTLKVEFQLSDQFQLPTLFGFHARNVNGTFVGAPQLVAFPPDNFEPFNIFVESVTNSLSGQPPPGLLVGFYRFTPTPQSGSYRFPDVTLIPVGGPTPVPYIAGNANTIAGFVFPASVTVTIANGSDPVATVEVTFSNDPIFGIAALGALVQGLPNNQKGKLTGSLTAASNANDPCKHLDKFISDVGDFLTDGTMDVAVATQLITAANQIKLVLNCQ